METITAGIQVLGGLYLLLFADPVLLFTAAPLALTSIVSIPFTAFMIASLGGIILGQSVFRAHDVSGPPQTEQFNLVGSFHFSSSQSAS